VNADHVAVVHDFITASQRARHSQEPSDLETVRRCLAREIEIRLAGPWTDEPWRVAHSGADQVVARLQEPSNAGNVLSTETVNMVAAGPDVLVEQLSTIAREGSRHTSMVCHIFTVEEGLITAIRSYRNDVGLPG